MPKVRDVIIGDNHASTTGASSSWEIGAGSVTLPLPASELPSGYHSDLSDSDDEDYPDYTAEAAVVSMPQEAVETVVWTRLANGRLMRTRYVLPDSGLTEIDIDAEIAAYYAAPRRLINGVWRTVRNGRVQWY
jgi:hypothetical protein